jgi:two-component system OmpR family sensor kinase
VHLQAQLAGRATSDAERNAALTELKGGLERDALVRAAAGAGARRARRRPSAPTPTSISPRWREASSPSSPAGRRQGRRSAPTPSPVQVRDDAALTTLVSNLVDNAVRYTPAGARSTSTCGATPSPHSRCATTVPASPPDDRARVRPLLPRRRFAGARGAHGSGLGLAIVRRIARTARRRGRAQSGLTGAA